MDTTIRDARLVQSRWARLGLLVVLCAAAAALEAGLVQRVGGLTAATYIAPQNSALWPYDTYHDVRWVIVYHRSWAGFVGESVAAVVVRGLFCTVLTALAWPAQASRPSLRRLAVRNVAFAAALGAFLSPWAVMSVVVGGVSLAWFLVGAILPVFILAPLLQRGAIVQDWWRGLPPTGTVVLSIVNFATLTAGSALIASIPPGWWMAMAALAGGVNGLLWYRAVRIAVLVHPARWRRVPVTPIVVAVVVGLMFAIGTIPEQGSGGRQPSQLPSLADMQADAVRRPVIVLAGYNSQYEGQASGSTLPVVRYSYRGLHPDGSPRPYSPVDTHQSLVTSARLLAEQVDQVHRATGQKLAMLGESEGTLIINYYLSTMPHQAVDAVVLLSPILRGGRIYYPPPSHSTGWGVATGWELRAVFAVLGAGNRLPDGPDQPLVRSLLDNAPLFRGKQMLCPVSGVRMIAFVPTLDAVTNLPGIEPGIPLVQVPGLHGQLVNDPSVRRQLVNFLNTGHAGPGRRWDYTSLQRIGPAWQAPALKVTLNPVWRNVAGFTIHKFNANECLRR